MNLRPARLSRTIRPKLSPVLAGVLCAVLLLKAVSAAPQSRARGPQSDFVRLATRLTSSTTGAESGLDAVQEQALAILDAAALEQLNMPSPNLDAANEQLAAFITHQPPIGENYRLVRLGGEPVSYALIANFGSAGPSAVRIYAGAQGQLKLAARIDRYTQKDFFDDYVVLAQLSGTPASTTFPASATLFLTVAGRTDDLQSGVFSAWRFDGRTVSQVWTSDILDQSQYQIAADGLYVAYCTESDPLDAGNCHRMEQDRYAWQGGQWKQVEATPLPGTAAKP